MKHILILLIVAFPVLVFGQGTVVYQSDFSKGVNGGTLSPAVTISWTTDSSYPGWPGGCSAPIDTTLFKAAPGQNTRAAFLGLFCRQDVHLLLNNLPPHDSIIVTFDFYAIGSWDGDWGPDIFSFGLEGIDSPLYATFRGYDSVPNSGKQSYPDRFGSGTHDGGTGSYSVNQFINCKDGIADAEYHLTYPFKSSSSTARFDFMGHTQPNGATEFCDEPWGLDSIIVQIIDCSTPPVAKIATNSPTTFCSGDSVVLRASQPATKYQWQRNGVDFAGNVNALTVRSSGSFRLIASNQCGQTDTATIAVTVNPRPTASIAGQLAFCQGTSTVLTASPSGMTYQWKKKGRILPSTRSITATDTGDYAVIVSNSSGCTDIATVHVSEIALPVATINGTLYLCQGKSTILTASPTGMKYQWEKNGSKIPGAQSNSLTVMDSGRYSVIVSNSSGCSDTTTVQVTEGSTAVATIQAQDTVLCNGSVSTLTAPSSTSYLWNDGEKSQTIHPTKAGQYYVTVTDANGCTATSRTVTVQTIPSPDVTLSSSTDTTICATAAQTIIRKITLHNNLSIPQKLYARNTSGRDFHGVADSVLIGPNSTLTVYDTVTTSTIPKQYSGNYTFQDSCGTASYSAAVNVSTISSSPLTVKLSMPANTALHPGDAITIPVIIQSNACISNLRFVVTHDPDFLDYSTSTASLQPDQESSGSERFTISDPPDSGVIGTLAYQTSLTTSDTAHLSISILGYDSSCPTCLSAASDDKNSISTIAFCGSTLMQDVIAGRSFFIDRIVPNPARDVIRIEGTGLEAVGLEVYDIMGRQVFLPQAASSGGVQLDIRSLAEGMYYLRLGNSTSRFVIER